MYCSSSLCLVVTTTLAGTRGRRRWGSARQLLRAGASSASGDPGWPRAARAAPRARGERRRSRGSGPGRAAARQGLEGSSQRQAVAWQSSRGQTLFQHAWRPSRWCCTTASWSTDRLKLPQTSFLNQIFLIVLFKKSKVAQQKNCRPDICLQLCFEAQAQIMPRTWSKVDLISSSPTSPNSEPGN